MNIFFSLPSLLSYLRIFLTPVFIFCFISGYSTLTLLIFSLAAITDYYDGYFARKLRQTSGYGMFLDPLADKVLMLTTFTVFYLYSIIGLWMVVFVYFREISITLLRVAFIKNNMIMKTSLFGKWKTVMQMVFIYFVLGGFAYYREQDVIGVAKVIAISTYTMLLSYIMIVFTVLSGLNYAFANRKGLVELFKR